jgi:hypothetical protein
LNYSKDVFGDWESNIHRDRSWDNNVHWEYCDFPDIEELKKNLETIDEMRKNLRELKENLEDLKQTLNGDLPNSLELPFESRQDLPSSLDLPLEAPREEPLEERSVEEEDEAWWVARLHKNHQLLVPKAIAIVGDQSLRVDLLKAIDETLDARGARICFFIC